MSRRRAIDLAAAAVVLAALWLSMGPPRLVWLNEGPRLDYPWGRAAAAAVGALALGVLAFGRRGMAARVLLGVAALGVLAWSADRALYSVLAGEPALRVRTLVGSRAIPWKEVQGVDLLPDQLVIRSAEGPLVVSTQGINPVDRPRFERTLSRRVREAITP
jgi:hypothetical protein